MEYRARLVDSELDELLHATGCVVLEGPKAVGKTATALRRAASAVLLDVDANARQLAALDPSLLLTGTPPRLMAEWQIEPSVWNRVRREVDSRGIPGQFILTGSAVPADDAARHTGAGRMSRLRIRPMTLLETGHSSGEVSLAALGRVGHQAVVGHAARAELGACNLATIDEGHHRDDRCALCNDVVISLKD